MDPDAAPAFSFSQALSTIVSSTLITVAFTACHTYRTDDAVFELQPKAKAPDTVASIKKPPGKKKKTIYLTFDDGPNKGTRKLADIIEAEQVPVTLFIVGEHVYGSSDQSAMYDTVAHNPLFEIANHSFTHAFNNKFSRFYAVPDSAVKDFMRCADSLQLTANIVRTPGRNIWRTPSIKSTDINSSREAADSLYNKNFTVMGWDLEWRFDNQLHVTCTEDELMQQVDSMFTQNRTKTAGHLVLLAHDQVYAHPQDSALLHQLIRKLKAKEEYDFEVISKYPSLIRN
jgi:peptidoglycan-N-acetylglucosamine deacetylase